MIIKCTNKSCAYCQDGECARKQQVGLTCKDHK
jgi:hypothetical protein